MLNNQDHFEVLRKIQKKPESSQRKLAEELGFSLGKLNYCLKALKQKGLIKTKNFQKSKNKLNYFYVLTPRGITAKTKLTIDFMKKKMREYDELKNELKQNENLKYGFQGRLSSKFPSQVMVDLTEVCNLACIHCTHPEFKESTVYGKRMLDSELNRKMINEVATHGYGITKYIRYTSNGEPLVHPKSYEMIQDAVENSKTKVTLTTNGTLLNEKRMYKILKTGLHMIDISTDAYSNETYKKIRVGGDLAVTQSNILKLIELKKAANANTKIIVSFVEQKENSHEVESFKNFWNSKEVDQVLIRRLHSNSGSNPYEKTNEDKMENRRACLYPWERVILNARGKLAFCPTDWYAKSELCSYEKNTINEIWKSNFYKDLRDQHLKCKFSNEFCKQCPDWKNTSWPFDKNKSYADLVERVLYEER